MRHFIKICFLGVIDTSHLIPKKSILLPECGTILLPCFLMNEIFFIHEINNVLVHPRIVSFFHL